MGCAGGEYRPGTRPWCVDSPDCAGRRLRGRCDIDKLLKLREQFCEISSRRQRPRGLPRLGSVQASMGRIHPRSVAVEHFHSCSRAAPRRRPTSPPPPRHTPLRGPRASPWSWRAPPSMALDTPLGFGRDVGVATWERRFPAVRCTTPPRTQGRRRRHWRSKARLEHGHKVLVWGMGPNFLRRACG